MNRKQDIFKKADILLPAKGVDLSKWCVVACDQYTSEPAYWREVEKTVEAVPSAYHLIYPEVFLEGDEKKDRIASIHETMEKYLREGVFTAFPDSFFYIERRLSSGVLRRGLVGMVDLESYDYHKGGASPVRATEGTVLSRIPPRVKVREGAALEAPHVMLLIDDPKDRVMGPLQKRKGAMRKLYETALMQKGGSLEGYLVDPQGERELTEGLAALYGGPGSLLFAVGDGNHSLATAKECYEQLKKKISPGEALTHPARYALAEVVNLHEGALVFEPIHRVLFGADPEELLAEAARLYDLSGEKKEGQSLMFICRGKKGWLRFPKPASNLTVGSLQEFLDGWLSRHTGAKIDYVHGDESAAALGEKEGNIAFLLPPMQKEELFETVAKDGALPRKTFSMGHAWDKRYYLECRKIR